MKVRILWVGKTKERYLAQGIKKYLERLGHFAETEVVEIKEEKGGSPESAVAREGERILRQAGLFVLLDEKGRPVTSAGLAEYVRDRGRVEFVLGGAHGVSGAVRREARDTVSLSPMTFTHEMARLVFLEQLYRAMTIIAGRGYHHP